MNRRLHHFVIAEKNSLSSGSYLFCYFLNVSMDGELALSWVRLCHCLPTGIASEFFLTLLWSQPHLYLGPWPACTVCHRLPCSCHMLLGRVFSRLILQTAGLEFEVTTKTPVRYGRVAVISGEFSALSEAHYSTLLFWNSAEAVCRWLSSSREAVPLVPFVGCPAQPSAGRCLVCGAPYGPIQSSLSIFLLCILPLSNLRELINSEG